MICGFSDFYQIEAIMNDYIQLRPQSNIYENETMVEGSDLFVISSFCFITIIILEEDLKSHHNIYILTIWFLIKLLKRYSPFFEVYFFLRY